jgi:regulatory protein
MEPRQPRLLDAGALWEYALRILSGRAYSIGELREKLRRRAQRAADIEEILARLKDIGYLDDRRFAEGFATARLAGDGLGASRVARDLRRRRVAPALAERTIARVYQDVDEEALITDFIRRKYRMAEREGLFQTPNELAAAYRRLLHAGFRPGAVLGVLKRFARNPELLDSFEPPEEGDPEA